MITKEIMSNSKNNVIVLDDMGDKFKSRENFYFTEERHYNFQMIAICRKAAHINNLARLKCDTIYVTTYNGADLFSNSDTVYVCNRN